MSLSKVIETARADIGYTENPPGSNMTKYGERYGLNGVPWCVIFLWDVFNRAGERMAFYNGGKTASCRTLLRCYKEEGKTAPVTDIQVGDILILNFSGKMYNGELDTEHCGLVVEDQHFLNLSGISPMLQTSVKTIEGNTSPGEEGSQDNGGCVALKTRYLSQIVAVCRPQYKPDDPQPVDDVSGHWAKASIEWATEHGLVKGYPDGLFKPNNPLTRAEACAIIERFYELLWEDDMR